MRPAPIALAAAALLLALAGCVPSTSHGSPSPHPSATPVFASDAAALKAAEAAYAAYLKVSDQIANDGGKNPERIAKYVTKDRLTIEDRGSEALAAHALHTTGSTTFSSASLEQIITASGNTEVAFYACWDASAVRVLDSSGNDVTPSGRPIKQTLEVVVSTVAGKEPLVLESDEAWADSSYC